MAIKLYLPYGTLLTSRCFVASSFLDISISLVRMLLRCMSLSRGTRLTVDSFLDWNERGEKKKKKNMKCGPVNFPVMLEIFLIMNEDLGRES